ncbi:MAG: rRNA pseudouridine synthase [Clostridia bacterium]|nr:rRNA pseudouridine synthase [Clostridia bacterium]
MERLDKILASQGAMSRKEVKEIIKQGRIALNGMVVKDSSVKIDENKDTVTFDGEVIQLKKHIYIMLNKPQGVISASDSDNDETVVDLVPAELYRKGLFPAGRLDKDTTGFVLITDDGEFAHRILSPRNHIFKTYIAQLEHPLAKEHIEKLENGIVLGDRTELKGSRVEVVEDSDKPLVRIMICEGKYHQVKRMFAATGNKVLTLHREKMGNLHLDDSLKPGECREITPDELEKITEHENY